MRNAFLASTDKHDCEVSKYQVSESEKQNQVRKG